MSKIVLGSGSKDISRSSLGVRQIFEWRDLSYLIFNNLINYMAYKIKLKRKIRNYI